MHGMINALQYDSGLSFSAGATATTLQAIGNLSSGDPPKFITLCCAGAAGVLVAVGDSNIDANATPHAVIALGQEPLVLNVFGMTHVSIRNNDAGAQTIVLGKLGNY